MKLQTEIILKPEQNLIDYSSRILLLGSCFSENIGSKLEFYKFQNTINPFGIIFNPVSLEKLILRAVDDEKFTEKDIFSINGYWHCFEVHSLLTSEDKNQFLSLLNSKLEELKNEIESATHIFFTFGTAWVYEHLEMNEIVANCHKVPQKQFHKKLLDVETIHKSIGGISKSIQKLNSEVTIVHTVSPVRHIKDGFVENSLSKAHLLTGVHKAVATQENQFYFPSYEIMMDELRDYRFYKDDMLHPNKTAIEIIWEKFNQAWISENTKQLQKEIANIQAGLQHRPFNIESEEYKTFRKKLQEKISDIENRFPQIHFKTKPPRT